MVSRFPLFAYFSGMTQNGMSSYMADILACVCVSVCVCYVVVAIAGDTSLPLNITY